MVDIMWSFQRLLSCLGTIGIVAEVVSKILIVFVLIKLYVLLDIYIKNNRSK